MSSGNVLLRSVADRLRHTFGALLRELPPAARSVSGLSAYTGVSRATCQRILEGLDGDAAAEEVFRRLPGPEALSTFCKALRKTDASRRLIEGAEAATAQYAELIASRSRSKRAFVDSLATPGPSQRAGSDRRALCEAAARAVGERVAVKSVVCAIRPDPRAKRRLIHEAISSSFGVKRRRESRPFCPFVVGAWWTRKRQDLPEKPRNDRSSRGASDEQRGTPVADVVERFTTASLKPVSLDAADAKLALVVDFPSSETSDWLGPIDLAVYFRHDRASNPLADPSARLSTAARITHPTDLLVLDIFLHPSLVGALPRAAVYALTAPPGDTPGLDESALWHERFPEDARLQMLGPATTAHPCAEFQFQDVLREELLQRSGKIDDGFQGFRWLVRHPLWQTEYRVSFPVHGRADARVV